MTRADALVAEAAIEALRAILACGAPAAAAAGTLLNPDEANLSNGAGERGWLAAATAFRSAGGVPVAVALLAFGPDRCIVRDALALLTALLCGEGREFACRLGSLPYSCCCMLCVALAALLSGKRWGGSYLVSFCNSSL